MKDTTNEELVDVASPGGGKINREFVVSYLRRLADSIEKNPKNELVEMPKFNTHSPKRAWYVAGEAMPQGFEYAGDIVVDIQIVLPRRTGERID